MTALTAVIVASGAVVAETPAPQQPAPDPNLISPGVLAFVSFVFLIVAVALLYRSMNRQLKKVSPTLPDGPSDRMREEDAAIIAEAERRGAEQARRRAPQRGPAAGGSGSGGPGASDPTAGGGDAAGGPRPSA